MPYQIVKQLVTVRSGPHKGERRPGFALVNEHGVAVLGPDGLPIERVDKRDLEKILDRIVKEEASRAAPSVAESGAEKSTGPSDEDIRLLSIKIDEGERRLDELQKMLDDVIVSERFAPKTLTAEVAELRKENFEMADKLQKEINDNRTNLERLIATASAELLRQKTIRDQMLRDQAKVLSDVVDEFRRKDDQIADMRRRDEIITRRQQEATDRLRIQEVAQARVADEIRAQTAKIEKLEKARAEEKTRLELEKQLKTARDDKEKKDKLILYKYKFYTDPTKDPVTGQKIDKSSFAYRNYAFHFGDPLTLDKESRKSIIAKLHYQAQQIGRQAYASVHLKQTPLADKLKRSTSEIQQDLRVPLPPKQREAFLKELYDRSVLESIERDLNQKEKFKTYLNPSALAIRRKQLRRIK